MSIYVESRLPFWAERDEKKRLVYCLPSAVRKLNVRRKSDRISSELKSIGIKVPYLGGFDGNGNHWPSNKNARVGLS